MIDHVFQVHQKNKQLYQQVLNIVKIQKRLLFKNLKIKLTVQVRVRFHQWQFFVECKIN